MWISRIVPSPYRCTKARVWPRTHWVILSTMPPMRQISLHSHRRVHCRECSSPPPPHEWCVRIPCTCLVVFTTCCTHFHRPSCDSWWSCAHHRFPGWDTVASTGCHRCWGLSLCVRGRLVWGVCYPRMCGGKTSLCGIRSYLGIRTRFPPSPALPRRFCTIWGTHRSTPRCDLDARYEGVPIDHRWDWESWAP